MGKYENQTYYKGIMDTWNEIYYKTYDMAKDEQTCPQMPKCKRIVYNMAIYPNTDISRGNQGSTMIIKMESPNVKSVVDSFAYDLQSLIGEVGGTLGLCLGLSMISFVDFFEFIIRKFFPNRM